MLQNKDTTQQDYFNLEIHQFPKNKIFKPQLQHQFEYSHIRKFIHLAHSKNIMDFGSGSGRLTIPLLREGYNVTAVDISQKSIDTLIAVYNKEKIRISGKLQTSPTIPQNKKFDAVVGSDILHHVKISTHLKELYNVLKPGGIAVFSEPNAYHIPWYLFFLLFYSWSVEKGILNCRKGKLIKDFQKAGFKNIRIEGHGILPTPLFNRFPALSRMNVRMGDLPLLQNFAFRFIISGIK